MWLLLLVSCELKGYLNYDQFLISLSHWVRPGFIMSLLVGFLTNDCCLTQSRMCLYYRFTTFCLLWLSWINASLSTMSHYFPYAIAIILFVSCTIVFSKTKGINLIHSFRTIVQQRKQHSTSQEILL